LDDLIVGAWGAGVSKVHSYTGRSYVIFGKTNTEAVNLANINKVENTAAHTIDFQGDTNTAEPVKSMISISCMRPLSI
jgi:hypothetical protein